MEKQIFNDWLSLVSDPVNALKHSVGTSIWLDGLEKIRGLTAVSFFRDEEDLSEDEARAIEILKKARMNVLAQDNFWVSGHSCLMESSPYYRSINGRESLGSAAYHFVEEEEGEFSPWKGISILGSNFYSKQDGQIRIPFYTFNHENTHLLFKNIYSNIEVGDRELTDLIVLVEWFCISMDLILAYDLIRRNQPHAFAEICRVPSKQSETSIFERHCGSIESVNNFADAFRSVFLEEREDMRVFDLISRDTMQRHRDFAQKNLLRDSRRVPSAMGSAAAQSLLQRLKTHSLSDLIRHFTGLQYA